MEAMKLATFATFYLACIVLSSNLVHCQQGSKDGDFIDELPNQPAGSHSRQYTGMVDIDPTKSLFYYFAEAAGGNATFKPLILWLNGDLVCSAMGGGAFQQIGPFRIDEDGQTLLRNPFAWNNVSNLLFVDPLPTVGFSKTTLKGTLKITDIMILNDLKKFMDLWFQRFPEFKNTEFYIGGQDYIGYIAPLLALSFVNKVNNSNGGNIKGLILGNPFLDYLEDNIGKMEYYWTHSVISDTSYKGYLRDCPSAEGENCFNYISDALDLTYKLSKNSIYARICNVDPDDVNSDNFEQKVYRCGDENVAGYMNMPFVQKSLHQDLSKGIKFWNYCNNDLSGTWDPEVFSNIPDIKKVLDNGMRVLVFSGDLDLNHPLIGTQRSLAMLNLTIDTPWRPWFGNHLEVAGYVETYKEGLTYTTVRNSGMWVGADQPLNSLLMLKSFLENKPFPSSRIFS